MIFDSSYYTMWIVFTFLEAVGIACIRKPEYRVIRVFLMFRLLSDVIVMAVSHNEQAYWDVGWTTKEIELVWLAGIAGRIVQPGRAWRLPAFTIAAICFHYLWTKGWPYFVTQKEIPGIFALERTYGVMILIALLIGAAMILRKGQLPLAGAIAVLTLADTVSAQSYLMGNYSQKVVACIWMAGLSILLAAAKARPRFLLRPLCHAASAECESLGRRSDMCIRLPLTPRPRFWT